MKNIFRNLIAILRRYKMAGALNIFGLSVAFTAFMIIMIQVEYEHDFDRCHPTSERVFRANLSAPGLFSTILPRGLVEEIIKSSPHIEAGTIVNQVLGDIYFTVSKGDEKIGYVERVITCHPEIVKVFGFPILEGDPNCLQNFTNVILPESMAKKMFGSGSAIGKTIHAEQSIWTKNSENKDLHDFVVGAVYRDFPSNTQLKNAIYTAMDNSSISNFSMSNFICYILLDNASSANDVVDNFNANFDFKNIGLPEEKIKLVALPDIYYKDETHEARAAISGNAGLTKLLFGIAFLILIVAAINYTNFSTSQIPVRIKSVNIQKVLGTSNFAVRFSLIMEAVLICVFTWLLAVLFVVLINKLGNLPFIDADLSVTKNWAVVIITGIIAVLTGIIASLYPSRYIISFQPALVLKGSFGLSQKGRSLRTILVGFQYVVSFAFIIIAMFMQLQNRYMHRTSLGFDKDQVMVVELNSNIVKNHKEAYVEELKQYHGIEDVAFASEKLASMDNYSTYGFEREGITYPYFLFEVSDNYLSVMGIDIVEGRNFQKSDELAENPVFIFNSTAKNNTGIDLGLFNYYSTYQGNIVGFTENIKITSFRQDDNNIAFCNTSMALPVSYIRIAAGTDFNEAIKHIRETLTEIDPAYPFEIEFFDSIINQMYQKETNQRSMITIFGLLAFVLSLMGVLGLVMFDGEYRRTEISVRKVFGSTTNEILLLFGNSYFKTVVVCFVISLPIAYYVINWWLESFTYRTPLYWWVFALSFLVVAFVTISTVTLQNMRAANTNPVDTLKS